MPGRDTVPILRFYWYEVWDRETRNLLLDADSQAEVLDIVAATVTAEGYDAVTTWFLVQGDDTEKTGKIVAEGSQLAELAMRAAASDDNASTEIAGVAVPAGDG